MSRDHEASIRQLLDWSDKQRRILTANGKAADYYQAELGHAYVDTELPHHHLVNGDTRATFRFWKEMKETNESNPIIGAWKRPVFFGCWEHSTDHEEHVFNLQTEGLFIDLRIPTLRAVVFRGNQHASSLEDLEPQELRYYARQHVFAGYSQISRTKNNNDTKPFYPASCTRHHCIDWNFVGLPRNR
jgi:hypothetical protein